jgi:hypothetical protein
MLMAVAITSQMLLIHFNHTYLFRLLQSFPSIHSKRQIWKTFPRPFPTPSFLALSVTGNRFLDALSTGFHTHSYIDFSPPSIHLHHHGQRRQSKERDSKDCYESHAVGQGSQEAPDEENPKIAAVAGSQ